MTNFNPKTGIAYGVISANTLDQDLVQHLLYGSQAYNGSYDDAAKEYLHQARNDAEEAGLDFDEFASLEEFNDQYEDYEPRISGQLQDTTYETLWLGGALLFWIFESPHTGFFQPCSPCVPGAADLDNPCENGIEGYTVPTDWLYKE